MKQMRRPRIAVILILMVMLAVLAYIVRSSRQAVRAGTRLKQDVSSYNYRLEQAMQETERALSPSSSRRQTPSD